MSRPYFIKLEAETIADKNVQSVLNDHKLYKSDWIYPETVDRLCLDEDNVASKQLSLNWIRDKFIPSYFENMDVYPIYESTQGYRFAGYVNGDYTHFYFYTAEMHKRHNVDKHCLIRIYRIPIEYFKALAQQNNIIYNFTQGNRTIITSKTYKNEARTV